MLPQKWLYRRRLKHTFPSSACHCKEEHLAVGFPGVAIGFVALDLLAARWAVGSDYLATG